jgi:hypothetical protein
MYLQLIEKSDPSFSIIVITTRRSDQRAVPPFCMCFVCLPNCQLILTGGMCRQIRQKTNMVIIEVEFFDRDEVSFRIKEVA